MRRGLLRWYRRAHRRLPWRAAPGGRSDPYAVLVSEAMLQQTQVATVIDYFERFMRRWPTLEALAAADDQQVLRLWQGLGYYRRARNLRRAAEVIVEQHGGRVPSDLRALRQLPGVGQYTAGAVASIAFGSAAPVLDGNVARVLGRVFAIAEPIDEAATRRRLWALAERFVRGARHPGDVNQALMELGATVCLPRSPRCDPCPLRRRCEARAAGRTSALPVKARQPAQREVRHDVLAMARRGRVLLERRGETGLWAGLWQLPTREGRDDAVPTNGALARYAHDRFGLNIAPPRECGAFTHVTTHRRIRFVVHRAEVVAGRLKRGRGVWRRPDDMDDLPMSNAQRRVTELILEAR